MWVGSYETDVQGIARSAVLGINYDNNQKIVAGFWGADGFAGAVSGATFVRLQSIEDNVKEQADVARVRSAVAQEMEINLLSYTLAT